MRNWAGNLEYRARRVLRPGSVDELQELVRSSSSIRPIGSRHSFNDLADTTGDHLSLEDLPRVFEVDPSARTVTVDGGVRYGDLCAPLQAAGLALHNLASLPHISIAGACATGTHGSGDRSGGLATAVRALEIVRADGELIRISGDGSGDSSDVPLSAAAVSLGALGVVTRLTLAVEPTFDVRQDVFEGLPVDSFVERFAEITAMADSVSFFTTWRARQIDQVWLKARLPVDPAKGVPTAIFGAVPATVELHPIPGFSPAACTPQLGVPGPWHERLPHFRLDHTPSAGNELQSEYIVGREHAVDAFLALARLGHRVGPLVQISEIRTIAPDELWLSPAFGRASVAFHFTWQPDGDRVNELLPLIEHALAPFEPRPHWGKLFTIAPDEVRSRYEKLAAFSSMAAGLDPTGKFRNAFIRRHLFD